ncbi:stalled ribosome sensor GCN1-like [Mytilus edulis]|uniref:stalled ribosome sensor GCN1-like n=1 Tax=Mytilus edulis TaxID=6550 RepID=UPI0039F14CF9
MAEHAAISSADILKKFAQNVTNPSTKERLESLNDVALCSSKQDLPENAVKGILKYLVQSVGAYQDAKSRRAVLKIIQILTKAFPAVVVKNTAIVLSSKSSLQTNVVNASHSLSGESLYALAWICVVLKEIYRNKAQVPSDDIKQLVSVQCGFVYGALAAGNKYISKAVYKKMVHVFKSGDKVPEEYGQMLQNVEPSMFVLSAASVLMKYLYNKRNQDLITKLKGPFLEIFVKHLLGSRTKPQIQLLVSCKDILRHCSHDDMKGQILPAAQKSMLRNPEVILESVDYLMSGLSLDLGQYVTDLSKIIGSQFGSKEENTRQEAAHAFKSLAEQCSDHEAVEKIVTHLFAVLNGSEGKLSMADQRISVLQAIGNVSKNAVSGANTLQNLSTNVSENFLTLLQSEVHEGTLVHALQMLSLWCTKFYTCVPDKLILWFKKALSLKTSTSAVRNAYLQCMNAAFQGDTIPQAVDLIPMLIQTVTKASGQANQSNIVAEGVTASCLLVKLSLVDIQAETKMGPFWSVVLDAQKQLFINDKFLSQVGDDVLMNVVTLSERLILEYPQKMTEKISKPYYGAIIYCLTHKSRPVRHHTELTIKRLLSLLGGTSISLALISECEELLSNQKFIEPELFDTEKESTVDQLKYIKPIILTRAVMTVSYVEKADVKDAEAIAKASLVPAHHPCIVYENKDTWTEIVAKLKLDCKNFVRKHLSECLKFVMTGQELSESSKNAFSCLVRIAPDIVLPPMIQYVSRLLGNAELAVITREEYGIFLTPSGELFDKSMLEKFEKNDDSKQANIKRENKLYSYAEQMAEIELRKELDKKKGRSVKETKPKLTKKQEEMLEAQREKESKIRSRLTELNQELCCGCQILEAALAGDKQSLCRYMKDLCKLIVPLLQSPLAAPQVSQVFLDLGQASFDDVQLGNLVSNVTLRLQNPETEVNSEWRKESPAEQGTRVVNFLYSLSISDNDDNDDENKLFPAFTFTFFYYLLSCVLRSGGEVVAKDIEPQSKAIVLISAHSEMRSTDDSDSDPALLPQEQMLKLLLQVITTSVSKLQQMASVGLTEVAESISGEEGCAKATPEEINILLDALMSPCTAGRDAAVQSLKCLSGTLPNIDDNYELGLKVAQRVWVACFDNDENVQKLAVELREKLNLEEPYEDMCTPLASDVVYPEETIQKAAAKALHKTLSHHPEYITATIAELKEKYNEKLYLPPPELDTFGRIIGEPPPDNYQSRSGIAYAMESIAPLVPQDQIEELFSFYVPDALSDRAPEVRSRMREAALAVINTHGKENVNILLPVFEDFLSSAPDTASNDAVRQSIVILMGCLAKHLDKDNPKIKPIVAQLIGALSTPSQEVQQSVANCLPPLIPGIRSDAPELVQRLMQLLLDSDNYGERKGAAYGLAGLVRGLGITALKQQEIMSRLEDAVKDKKNPRKREGALFAYEMLCTMLGKLFEPYVVHILPHLLFCFGDSSQYVREAADDTARGVMGMLTAHGVKLVLPSLLKGLEEDAWRTKAGAVELLGAMAYCAPKQLSACLPNIVPKLTEVLTDSHVKVQKAGAQALRQIGDVIKNPEIQVIVPVLLDALQDPAKKTLRCLRSLLETKFVHFIDAPSLALIMPVVERAFQDRQTETRKMAAQIIGNMSSLTDQKDLDPYIEKLIPGLKQSLLDPVPEVRTVSAKALGAMVRGIGGAKFDELLKWLMDTLKSEANSVDRSGAAQGLAEVIGGLGQKELNRLMPGIIQTAERVDIPPFVRDGYIMLYIYLPSVFKDDFMEYIGPIIPSILQALADESEYVRETALLAGQRIINLYADQSIELLLPELEKGLFDDNWRIRYSSVQLLGDLLYRISGVTGKMTTETAHDDDNFGTETSGKAILKALGKERRARVLAGLYMGRSDTALLVRQSALHVWKIIVAHTPQTLREILGTLFTLLLGCLASTSHDKRQVAARTLGDLVKKLGERVLPEIIPILEHGLDSDQADQRQGVCIGLTEIMASTSRDHVAVYAESLIPTVRKALIDPLPAVRDAAAHTFENLHANIGPRALDEILPYLLSKLDDDDLAERALDGLRQVMTVKSYVVLPYLIPQLTATPVNTKALSFLSSVAGETLTKYLIKILPALLSSLSKKWDTPEEAQEMEYCKRVVLSVKDDTGVRIIITELLSASSQKQEDLCWAAITVLHQFCEHTDVDYSDYMVQLFRGLIALFIRKNNKILLASWECLSAVTKKIEATEMLQYIADVRQAVKYAVSDMEGKELPGFSIPKKGITPVLPIFREGILSGTQELKEQAAVGLGELIDVTNAEALKVSVLNITGPLIRILGDRFVWSLKVAVLDTLTKLLTKVGVMLKPFLPQLQTTFLKALNDPQRSVRLKAASALGQLIIIHVRVDPLFTELLNGIKNATETGVRDTMLQALRFCLTGAGSKMAEPLKKQASSSLLSMLGSQEETTRSAASACLGAMCGSLSDVDLTDVMISHLLDSDPSQDWMVKHGQGIALGVALRESADKLCKQFEDSITKTVLDLTTSDRIPLCLCGYRCLGYLLIYQQSKGQLKTELLTSLIKGMKNDSNDVKQLVTQIIPHLSSGGNLTGDHVKLLIPPLVMGTKEKNTVVKTNSEIAVVAVLHLRKDETVLKSVSGSLDAGMRESLNELVYKSLVKLCKQPESALESIDDTVLK